ncbi:hypothetical protein IW138_000811 [Coemansia sp. RSA 986]|nr:hypothetical protein LPJ74_000760 [Coemansia sp. RSA 1843]KAJ2092717.1 hypothetical protein IW138_000811 [Coemansia sp. RSA 986]
MKFMQRSADRAKADAEKKLERKMIDESHWRAVYSNDVVSEERPKVQVIYETSYLKMPSESALAANDTAVGRRSFNSFKQNAEALKSEQDASVQKAVEDQIRSEKSKTPRPSKLSSASGKASPKPQTPQSLRERSSQLKRKHE